MVHALEHVVQRRPARRLQRRRRRRAGADRGGRPARQALRADPAAVGHRPRGGRRCAALGLQRPSEMLSQLRFGRGVDNRRLKAAGFEYRYTTPRDRDRARRAPAPASDPARRARALPLRARGRGVPALEPERAQLARPRTRPVMSREQMVELQKLLAAYETHGRGTRGEPAPSRVRSPARPADDRRSEPRREGARAADAAACARRRRPLRRPRGRGDRRPARLAGARRSRGAARLRARPSRARRRDRRVAGAPSSGFSAPAPEPQPARAVAWTQGRGNRLLRPYTVSPRPTGPRGYPSYANRSFIAVTSSLTLLIAGAAAVYAYDTPTRTRSPRA